MKTRFGGKNRSGSLLSFMLASCLPLMLAMAVFSTPVLADTVTFSADLPGPIKQQTRDAVKNASASSFFSEANAEDKIEAIVAVLRSEGYYGADVTVAREDPLVINVAPGPVFRLSQPRVEIAGEAPPQLVRDALPSLINQPARTVAVLTAESVGLNALRTKGYADAAVQPRAVIVDHATTTMNPTLRYASGNLVRLGLLSVTGAKKTPASWFTRLPPWQIGDTYSPESLRILEDRIRATRAYSDVTVSLSPSPTATTPAPRTVTVAVTEEAQRAWAAGLSWSTLDGFGVDVTQERHHQFRLADTLTLRALAATREQSIAADWYFPHALRADRNLELSARIANENNDAFKRQIVTVSGLLDRPTGKKATLTLGLATDLTRTERAAARIAGQKPEFDIVGDVRGTLGYTIDRSDSVLNPSMGWRGEAKAEPSVLYASGFSPYARLSGAYTRYQRVGFVQNGVLAGRVKLGFLVGGDGLPVDRKFFAGGGGSVRGYAYQAIGPKTASGDPLGGRAVLETALEARWTVRGKLGAAIFVDGASVAETTSDLFQSFRVGAGFGVRYDLGFAPIRIDIATPLNPQKGDGAVQLYVSVGQAF